MWMGGRLSVHSAPLRAPGILILTQFGVPPQQEDCMAGIDAAVRELKARREALADELRKIDQALEVLAGLGTAPAAVPARRAGRWRPGGRGRPPKAYAEKQAVEKGATKAPKRKTRRRKPPTEKQLAALEKARAAMAAKRAKAAAAS